MFDGVSKPMELAALDAFVTDIDPDTGFQLPDSPETSWTVIFTNAGFDASQTLNHYVPAISAHHVGRDYYDSLVHLEDCRVDLEVSELQSKYLQLCGKRKTSKSGEEDPALLAKIAAAQDEWLLAHSWQQFRERCKGAGLHPLNIPADGNCLLWSVHCFLTEEYDCEPQEWNTPQRLANVKELRNELTAGWKKMKSWSCWQSLFQILGSGQEETTMPATPKSPPPKKRGIPESTTPIKDERFDKAPVPKKKQIRTVEMGQTAPQWKRQDASTFSLHQRPLGKGQASMPEDDEDLIVPDSVEVKEAPTGTQRKRTCKRKIRSISELQLKRLRSYMNECGVTYQLWMHEHWSAAGLKKAGKCQDGKWTELQGRLLKMCLKEDSNPITCKTCQKMIELSRFSAEDACAALESADKPEETADMEFDEEEVAEPTEVKQEEKESLDLAALARSISPYFEVHSVYVFQTCSNHFKGIQRKTRKHLKTLENDACVCLANYCRVMLRLQVSSREP